MNVVLIEYYRLYLLKERIKLIDATDTRSISINEILKEAVQ